MSDWRTAPRGFYHTVITILICAVVWEYFLINQYEQMNYKLQTANTKILKYCSEISKEFRDGRTDSSM